MLSTSFLVCEKLHLTLWISQQASQAQHTPSCPSNICFLHQCFLISSHQFSLTTFSHIDNILSSHTGSKCFPVIYQIFSNTLLTEIPCCQGVLGLSSCCLLGCCLFTTAASFHSVSGPSVTLWSCAATVPCANTAEIPQFVSCNSSWSDWLLPCPGRRHHCHYLHRVLYYLLCFLPLGCKPGLCWGIHVFDCVGP